MSSNASPTFAAHELAGAAGADSLSIALIGPDKSRRAAVAMALAQDRRAGVSEFESYPARPAEFKWLLEQGFDTVLFDLDSAPDVVMDLVGRVRSASTLSVMVYSEQADTKLAVRYMRAGAREYLLLPLEEGIVSEALDRAVTALSERTQSARSTAGKLLVFVCAKGGCGVTTVACNLAVALAGNPEQKTLLIDLALPIGDAALALGLAAKYSIEDAIRNAERLDARLLKELLVRHRSGAFVLAAPSSIPGIEGCGEAIDKLIAIARREFDYVIVDVGSRMDLAGTALFKQASTIYLVTLTGVSELRNSNRLISQFFPEGGPSLEVVVNRFEGRLLGGVNEDVVAKALGRPVRWTVPEDREAAREMQFGVTGVGDTRLSRLGLEMAGEITGRAVPQERPDKKKGFSLKGIAKTVAEETAGVEDPLSLKIAPPAVAKSTPEINWTAPAPISYGDALSTVQLNATAPVAGAFIYEPGAGSVLPAGTHKLSAVFTPAHSEQYATAQATVLLKVERSAPAIDWTEPDPIPYGTALGSDQLCATASAPGRLDYTPAAGEVLAAGTHTLSVKLTPTDAGNYTGAKAAVKLAVAKATPVVAWPAPKPMKAGTRLGEEQLCATASVAGRFDYSRAAGTLLSVGMHTLRVRFTPADAENYATVEASVALLVEKAAPEIVWPSPGPILYGQPLNEKHLCATASVPGKLDYSPALGAVLAAGTHALSAAFTPADSTKYSAATATVSITVGKAAPSVEWPALKPVLVGARLGSKQLCATASVAGRFEYSPAPGEALAAGTHTLSAIFTPADSANYATAQASVTLTVIAKSAPVLSWPNPRPIPYGTPLNRKQLCATASVPGTFEYSTGAGEVLAAGSHALSVKFTPADSENYSNAEAGVTLKVDKATPTIDWPAPKPILDGTLLGAKQLCAATPVPGRFDYSPLPGVALPPGRHTLSVIFTPADRANYSGAQATVPLTVVAKATPVIGWAKPALISYGTILGPTQLCATASVPGEFDYSPGPGVVLAAGTHTLSVTFTPSDSENYATVEATVPLHVDRTAPVVTWSSPDPVPYGAQLGVKQLCATASVAGRFDYSPGPGATLNAGTHALSVTFTPADSANYTAVRATVPLAVTKATPNIEWPAPQSIRCDTALGRAQLCATSRVPGTFDYEPGPGHVLAAGTHALSVTFTPADTVNYLAAQATVSIDVVVKPAPVIAWPNPDPIPYGTPLGSRQLCATASVPGKFTYSATAGEVLAAGTHTLSATFIPKDKAAYDIVRAAVSLQVEKVAPSIDWPAPQPIKPGTPLSDLQLDAAAWVPGNFVYSPAAGEVLAPGAHTLSVTFTPTDLANYHAARAAVTLKVVDRAMPVLSWPNPDPIVYGAALGAAQLCATASVPGTFTYSPARGEVLSPGMHKLSVTFVPADAEEYLPAQAVVALLVEALRDAHKPPAAPELEEPAEHFQKPAAVLQWPEVDSAADEVRLTPDWLNLPDAIPVQPLSSKAGLTGKFESGEKSARRKWIFAAAGASLLVLATVLAVPRLHLGRTSAEKIPVARPAPVAETVPAPDTRLKPVKPKPSAETPAAQNNSQNTAQDEPAATADAADAVPAPSEPTAVQAEMMHDQLTAPAKIPQPVQKQVAAGAAPAPPPGNFSTASLGGSGAIGNVFAEKAPRIVAAAPRGPLPIPASLAMNRLIEKKVPVYPQIARQARVSGAVELAATISKTGAIESLHVLSGPAMLREAALDAVRSWRYQPYIVNNAPIEVTTTITVVFALGE